MDQCAAKQVVHVVNGRCRACEKRTDHHYPSNEQVKPPEAFLNHRSHEQNKDDRYREKCPCWLEIISWGVDPCIHSVGRNARGVYSSNKPGNAFFHGCSILYIELF